MKGRLGKRKERFVWCVRAEYKPKALVKTVSQRASFSQMVSHTTALYIQNFAFGSWTLKHRSPTPYISCMNLKSTISYYFLSLPPASLMSSASTAWILITNATGITVILITIIPFISFITVLLCLIITTITIIIIILLSVFFSSGPLQMTRSPPCPGLLSSDD